MKRTLTDEDITLLLKECANHPDVYNKVANIIHKDFSINSAELALMVTYCTVNMNKGE